jgi:hypothetical protein
MNRRWIISITLGLAIGLLGVSDLWAGSVRGYYRHDGTYVRPHQRTAPDHNPFNNYGFPGNVNPNTGQVTPGNPQRYLERYDLGQPITPVNPVK